METRPQDEHIQPVIDTLEGLVQNRPMRPMHNSAGAEVGATIKLSYTERYRKVPQELIYGLAALSITRWYGSGRAGLDEYEVNIEHTAVRDRHSYSQQYRINHSHDAGYTMLADRYVMPSDIPEGELPVPMLQPNMPAVLDDTVLLVQELARLERGYDADPTGPDL